MNDTRRDHVPGGSEARLVELVDRWFDDDLGPAESAELEAVLLRSAVSRQRFWSAARFHMELQEAAALTAPADVGDVGAAEREAAGGLRVAWMPAAILAGLCLAIGGGLGVLLASRALAGLEQPVPRLVLLAEGFEDGDPPSDRFLPTVAGVWSGDVSAVVGPSGDVVPSEGQRMLQFIRPTPAGADSTGEYASEVWRIIPIDGIQSQLLRGEPAGAGRVAGLVVEFVAAFNQQWSPDGVGDKAAGVNIFAFRGDPADSLRLWKDRESLMLASSRVDDVLDRDPAGWQRLRAILAVPAGTDFLLLHGYVRDRDRRPEAVFDGQYMDDLHVTAWIDPGAAAAAEESP